MSEPKVCSHCHEQIIYGNSGPWVHVRTMRIGCEGVSATPTAQPNELAERIAREIVDSIGYFEDKAAAATAIAAIITKHLTQWYELKVNPAKEIVVRPAFTHPAAWQGIESDIVFYAFRYCLGRQTYAVNDCVNYLVENWQRLPRETAITIQNDIRTHFNRVNKDVEPEWQRVLILNLPESVALEPPALCPQCNALLESKQDDSGDYYACRACGFGTPIQEGQQ